MFGDLNTGTISTNKKGRFGLILCCLDKEDIYDIFSIPKLENGVPYHLRQPVLTLHFPHQGCGGPIQQV